MKKTTIMTRGERNHNPLNVRRSKGTHWLGQLAVQRDREFVQFQCDLMGYRAAIRILRTYMRQYHLQNINDIIHRWAPPEDGNLTGQYVRMVSDISGIAPATPLTFEDSESVVAIVAAMARVESGITKPDMRIIREAYLMVAPAPL